MSTAILLSRPGGLLALTQVSRHFGVLWALMSSFGCSDRVELLSTLSADPMDGPSAGGTTGGAGASGDGSAADGGGSGTVGTGGAGGADSGSDGAVVPWAVCVEALSRGSLGDPCSFEDECTQGDRCSYVRATCRGGTLVLAREVGTACQTPCTHDRQCLLGQQWCEAGFCVPCIPNRVETCEHRWIRTVFQRNGCDVVVCVPPTACTVSSDCVPGEQCYAGQACEPDCAAGDPTCCYGNFCARAGCDAGTIPLSCEQLGCPLGMRCAGGDWSGPRCACDGIDWQCREPEQFYRCQ